MSDGKDGAIDVTVTSPLASSNVAGAEAQAGASLAKACQRKVGDTADACQREGLVFLPFAMETLEPSRKPAVWEALPKSDARQCLDSLFCGSDETEPNQTVFQDIR